MIRDLPTFHKLRRGLSLLEMAYALLIMGIVLGVLWTKAATLYQSLDITHATQELASVVQATRTLHQNSKVTADENMDLLNLPSDMVGHFKGQTIVFNPWRGRISLFPGNAMGLGEDQRNDEFTVRYDGVPSDACRDMIVRSVPQMLNLGLVAVYISPKNGEGKEICFAEDSVCRNAVSGVLEGMIDRLCQQKSRMSVMFTFLSR